VLEINRLLREVQPLSGGEGPSSEVTMHGLHHPTDEVIDEDIFHDAPEDIVPIQLSGLELRQSVADFLEICLQELHDLTP